MSGNPGPFEIRRSPFGPYRVRGQETTRLEGFSDAVFGFELSELEAYDARSIFWHYMSMILMALVSVALSAIGVGMSLGGIAGWIYGLLGPIMTAYWMVRAKRRVRMERSLAS